MGVMSCSRKSCDSIMCETYVDSIGYVCRSCQKEFKNFLITSALTAETSGEIRRSLKIFIETEKNDYVDGEIISIDEFFNSYTRD